MPIEKKEVESKDNQQDLKEIIQEFADETDRAAVILGAAKLDTLLYQLIVIALLPNAGSIDELFDGDAPLSTFSAKINLSYRLGLIAADLTHALHLVRKIRNSFAHEMTSRSLEAGTHRDRIRELVSPLVGFSEFAELKSLFFKNKTKTAADFRAILAVMIGRLHAAINSTTPISWTQPINLIPTPWVEVPKTDGKDNKTQTSK